MIFKRLSDRKEGSYGRDGSTVHEVFEAIANTLLQKLPLKMDGVDSAQCLMEIALDVTLDKVRDSADLDATDETTGILHEKSFNLYASMAAVKSHQEC